MIDANTQGFRLSTEIKQYKYLFLFNKQINNYGN